MTAVNDMGAPPRMHDPNGALFAWLVPASVALHVALVAAVPGARATALAAPPVVVVEMAAPPAEPPPQPRPPEAEPPTPTPRLAVAAPGRASTSAARAAAPSRGASSDREASEGNDAPVDFTSAVFSSEGLGVAVGGGSGRAAATPASAPVSPRPSVETPRFVPVGSLARAPSAPGLDAELERNYPVEARSSGISGSAVLHVEILADGRVGRVDRVSESFRGFADACTRTVRAGRWQAPLAQDGRAVSTQITYTCRFEVRT